MKLPTPTKTTHVTYRGIDAYEFDSKSRPGLKHYTLAYGTEVVACSCEGWQSVGHCWHSKLVGQTNDNT